MALEARSESRPARDPLTRLAERIAGRAQSLAEGFDRYFEQVLSRGREMPGSERPDGAGGQPRTDPHHDRDGGLDR
jgi:hypothetical protein